MDESSDPSMGENAPSFKRARKQVNYIETSSSVDSEDEDTNDTDDDYEREVKSSSRRKTLRKKRDLKQLLYFGKLAVGEEASACAGSFGTYLCYHSKSANATMEDFERGWEKILLSERPGKLCEWAPINGGRFLAVGSVASDGRCRVHLYDCAYAKNNMHKEAQAFQFHVSYGINSLS